MDNLVIVNDELIKGTSNLSTSNTPITFELDNNSDNRRLVERWVKNNPNNLIVLPRMYVDAYHVTEDSGSILIRLT